MRLCIFPLIEYNAMDCLSSSLWSDVCSFRETQKSLSRWNGHRECYRPEENHVALGTVGDMNFRANLHRQTSDR